MVINLHKMLAALRIFFGPHAFPILNKEVPGVGPPALSIEMHTLAFLLLQVILKGYSKGSLPPGEVNVHGQVSLMPICLQLLGSIYSFVSAFPMYVIFQNHERSSNSKKHMKNTYLWMFEL